MGSSSAQLMIGLIIVSDYRGSSRGEGGPRLVLAATGVGQLRDH